jgi:hypothetical protein
MPNPLATQIKEQDYFSFIRPTDNGRPWDLRLSELVNIIAATLPPPPAPTLQQVLNAGNTATHVGIDVGNTFQRARIDGFFLATETVGGGGVFSSVLTATGLDFSNTMDSQGLNIDKDRIRFIHHPASNLSSTTFGNGGIDALSPDGWLIGVTFRNPANRPDVFFATSVEYDFSLGYPGLFVNNKQYEQRAVVYSHSIEISNTGLEPSFWQFTAGYDDGGSSGAYYLNFQGYNSDSQMMTMVLNSDAYQLSNMVFTLNYSLDNQSFTVTQSTVTLNKIALTVISSSPSIFNDGNGVPIFEVSQGTGVYMYTNAGDLAFGVDHAYNLAAIHSGAVMLPNVGAPTVDFNSPILVNRLDVYDLSGNLIGFIPIHSI